MSTLIELMRDVAEHQPDDGFTDPTTLTTLGRGRVRRRRTTAGVVAAAAVAVAVVPFAIHAASGPEPAPPTGKVISLDSAVPAVAGVDYTTLSTVTNRMLSQGPGRLGVQGTLPNGQLVVSRLAGKRERTVANGLLDPATGKVSPFPPRKVGLYLGRADDKLVYGPPNRGGADPFSAPDLPYQFYNVSAGTWRALPPNPAVDFEYGGSRQSQVISNGMLFIALDTTPTRTLWRVDVNGVGAWTQVGTVGAFGVGSGSLASTRSLGHDPGTLTLRDLAEGGGSTSHPLEAVAGCVQGDIDLSATYVVRQLSCGRPPTGLTNQLVFIDHQGKPLGTVTAGYLELDAVSRSAIVFSVPDESDNSGYPSGTYSYHPATGRLVRLSSHAVDLYPFLLPRDPVQLWRTSDPAGDGPGDVRFDVVVPH